jgi:G6PDH family F420-dependent oxidoreductase
MGEIGYKLCSEEHNPQEIIQYAQRAEQAGFTFGMISDHFHPWTDKQGQSPFVWSVIGGISQVTKHLRVGTGVTCPILRIHPAIIAQASATAAAMMPGRFMLGLGSGENLNEHIVAKRWPPPDIRQDMMEEAVEVIRLLWKGEEESHYGKYFTVENARIYTLPEELPPILIAAGGPKAAELAADIGNGLIAAEASEELVKKFNSAGGKGEPCYAEMTVCWAKDEREARRTAHKLWPIPAFKGNITAELPKPSNFEQAAEMVTEDDIAKSIICGPNSERYLEKLEEYSRAGFDHVWIHQVGPDQEGFFRFFEREIQPKLS